MNDDKYESIVDEAFSYELKKTEPPTLMQYIRSLRNNEFRKDELNRIFSKGPIIRDPETNEAYTNPLKVLGDAFDYVNDQVSLKKLSPMLKFLPEDNTPSVLKDVADYSLKDFQYDVTGAVEEKVSGMTDNQFLGGLAAFGTALMIPDATDALFPGAADTVKYAKRIDPKRLDEIFSGIFDGGSPFTRAVTPEGVEVPNTFFKSVSEGSSGRFVPPTSKQIYDTKQKLITNNIADGKGRFIWEQFSKNKKGRSNWGRLMSKEVQTVPYSKETWSAIKKELQNDFSSIYPDSLLKNIKVQNSKGQWVALQKKNIEVEHIFTLQQSMPMFANVEWGGEVWQEIAQQVLSRQFSMGDTRQNLIAVPQHIHRIKTQFFNKFAGIDGTRFWTKDVIERIKVDEVFRKEKIDEWLDKVEEGKKIIDDGLTIWETLYKGKEIPNMPEELVEKLSDISLDEVDIKKVIPQIFAEFEAEGFTNTALKKADLATEKIENIKLNKRKILNAEQNEMVEYFEKAAEQWNKQNAKFTPWDSESDAIEYATKALKSQFVDKKGQLSFFNKSGMTLEEAANIYGNLLFETNKAR